MEKISRPRWDTPAVLLLLGLVLSASLRLVVTNWTSGLNLVPLLVLLAFPLGLLLGMSRFRTWLAALLGLGYSLLLLPGLLAGMLYEKVAWLERFSGLAGRLVLSLDLFFHKKPVQDTFLFVLLATLIFWTVSLLAGYHWARHRRLLPALLPVWVLILAIQVYDNYQNNRIIFIILCMFFSLLLLGRRFILEKRLYWQQQHIRYSAESSRQLTLYLLIFTSLIILLTWAIPISNTPVNAMQVLWDRISQPWQSARKDLGNAVAGLQGSTSPATNDFYNADLFKLGQRAILGDSVIFQVKLPDLHHEIPYYWRARVFDQYANGQWSTSPASSQEVLPDRSFFELNEGSTTQPSTFTFSLLQGRISTLLTPAQTTSVSRPVFLTYFQTDVTSLDPLLLRSRAVIQAGESYQVQAFISNPTQAELRLALGDYPDWVKRHYLQLPANLAPRIRNLATQLTADQPTEYDRAQAITTYLRREIRYSQVVPRPPLGADLLEWFLFDYKQGYCNYYATAEVVLLRSAGIPARLVVGFAQGQLDLKEKDLAHILQKDAHAWPEVWFPGIGWVAFEPTVSQPAILRPAGQSPLPGPAGSVTPLVHPEPEGTGTARPLPTEPETGQVTPLPTPEAAGAAAQAPAFVIWGFSFLVLALVIVLVWRSRRLRATIPTPLPVLLRDRFERNTWQVPAWLQRWADRASRSPVQRAFTVVWTSLRRLGKPARASLTPQQACTELAALLPSVSTEINLLCREYQKSTFSRQAGDADLSRQASRTIRRETNHLLRRTWSTRLKARFTRPKGRRPAG